VASVALCAAAQAPTQAPTTPKPDSAQVRQLLGAAKATAGTDWPEAFDYFCAPDQTRVNRADDPELQPTKVFDNLYVVGRTGTAVWILDTGDGLVLIDAGYADQVDSVLLAGMRKLSLDPARVKYVFITHGHADHYGGASYFQQRGAHVVMAAADWELVEGQSAQRPAGAAPPALPAPHRDIVATDGQAIGVGSGAMITPVAIPGHTPGSIGLIFGVTDNGAAHTAGLFGGTVLLPGRLTAEALQRYIASIDHWADVTRRMNVDVEIQNHPLYDGLASKLQRLAGRRRGDGHPFVVGVDAYQRFVRVMSGCMSVQAARHGG
jgi:metallo-beta-lactamase class B